MQLELKRVIESVGKEKNINKELIIDALKEAVLSAARKHFGDRIFEVRFNEESEQVELINYKIVVDDKEFVNSNKQIKLSDALNLDSSLQLGDEIGENLPTSDLGRIAAQSAKQAILQKVLEAEKDKILSEFREKKYQIISGQVKRFDKQDLIVDLGSTEAVLPVREQIPGEKYKIKDKILCYVLDVKKSTRGPQVVLSRACPDFLVKLFEQEVTEIADGIVAVKSAARDPGSRSKIAVVSHEPTIDPVGACVGLKGVRVQAIVQELKGEKIDIIPYDRDPARFVCNALAPAEPSKVIVNERIHVMEVVVPDEHLSLAIGRRGQNVRLAAQLTGWKVDIRSESNMKVLLAEYKATLSKISSLGDMRSEILVQEGYKDPADIACMDVRFLMKLLRLSEEEASKVIEEATELEQKMTDLAEAQSKEEDAELEELFYQGSKSFDLEQPLAAHEEIEFEDLLSKAKRVPLIDPEKVDLSLVKLDDLEEWLNFKGVGEQAAACFVTAGFKQPSELADLSIDEIVYRTGLPPKFVGKVYADITGA